MKLYQQELLCPRICGVQPLLMGMLDLRHMVQVSDNFKVWQRIKNTVMNITHHLELIMRRCDQILHFSEKDGKKSYDLNDLTMNGLMAFYPDGTKEGEL